MLSCIVKTFVMLSLRDAWNSRIRGIDQDEMQSICLFKGRWPTEMMHHDEFRIERVQGPGLRMRGLASKVRRFASKTALGTQTGITHLCLYAQRGYARSLRGGSSLNMLREFQQSKTNCYLSWVCEHWRSPSRRVPALVHGNSGRGFCCGFLCSRQRRSAYVVATR